MNHKEILNFLYNLQSRKYNLDLKAIKQLLNRIGNPEKSLKAIHIAGTNGKGSVCAMLSSILKEANYKVGMYTSPHLKKINERIMINNEMISDEELLKYFNIVHKSYKNETFFEFFTALAFLYFKEKKIDILVCEVGLGGRLDATNVVDPLVSVITNINKEHMEYLGDTIEKIAYEKAGIIKEKIPVVTGAKEKALDTIKHITEGKKSELFLIKNYKKINNKFDINSHKNLRLSPKGDFQLENASITITTIDVLNKKYDLGITEDNIKDGLLRTTWHGRLDFLEKNLLVDCAHNPAGIIALKKEILRIKNNYDKIILVIGILKDKDYKTMLDDITPLADKIILTKAKINRATDPKELAKYVDKEYKIIEDVKEAVGYAKSISKETDLILVTGSIYVVGEVIR